MSGASHDLLLAGLEGAAADHLSLRLETERLDLTRAANNGVTQHLSREVDTLVARAWLGQRVGTASTSEVTASGISECVGRAVTAAEVTPENPEALPPLDGSGVAPIDSWDHDTATMSAADRVSLLSGPAGEAGGAGRDFAGTVSSGWRETTIATTSGAALSHRGSQGGFSGTLRDPSGASVREAVDGTWRLAEVGPAERLARLGARISPGPATEAAPGRYRVLLEADAVASLLIWILVAGEARAADEGRSAFADNGFARREDGRLLGPGIRVWSDPAHQGIRAAPFDEDGHPLSRRVWIEDGRLEALPCSRWWARESGRPSTGSTWTLGLDVEGEPLARPDLLAEVGDGLLVPRFWYNRFVEPMGLLITGLTRDGLMRVEGGQEAGRLRNFRYNESPLSVLGRVVAAGAPEAVAPWGVRMWVPPLVVEGFNMTSVAPGE